MPISFAGKVRAGDVELHAEVRGDGPPVVLVPGAGGDAGQYARLASQMSDRATVITYDRRSNSRSDRAADWSSTSVGQQANDLAELVAAVAAGPVDVFGNSIGAVIATAFATAYPDRVARLVVHEPAVMAVLAEPDAAMAVVQPVIAAGMQTGGPRGGAEAFLRFAAGAAYELIDPDCLERMLDNAEVLFQAEFGTFSSWAPQEDTLGALTMPIEVLVAEQSAPFFAEAAEWIAERAGARVETVPGGHMGFLEHPEAFATRLAGSGTGVRR